MKLKNSFTVETFNYFIHISELLWAKNVKLLYHIFRVMNTQKYISTDKFALKALMYLLN